MDLQSDIDIFLRSRYTLIVLVSFEEEYITEQVRRMCQNTKRSLLGWDLADHFQVLVAGQAAAPTEARDPLSALEAIQKMDGQHVFLLRDFHQCWHNQPRVIRKLRSLAQQLKYTRKSIVITAPTSRIPDELKDEAVLVEVPPPGFDELSAILDRLVQSPGIKVDLDESERSRLIRAALGLSSSQAQRVFSKAIVHNGVLNEEDIQLINSEKQMLIRESGALEFYSPRETVGDVGGLHQLKKWLKMREKAFSPRARAYGLPQPRGIALIGIPGTGKSLTAKAVAGLWQLPLLRLDIGALFGGLVGQSEENTRRALHLAETIAPCLLWIDEIEKGLSTGGGDGGTSLRVFGTILSWMQEKSKPVFVIATANDISRLPPELLRRGRFDEIFFLDLPNSGERQEILKVHIRKRNRQPDDYDVAGLARRCEGFVGAEIEQSIIDAMYLAFNDDADPEREFTTGDIEQAMAKLVPMCRSQKETIDLLRLWLVEGRAQSASHPEAELAKNAFVDIQLDPMRG